MGMQDHPFPIVGRIGKFTFYRTKLGHMVREARGVSGDKILNDPKFEITRQNMAEFGRVAKAGKLIRKTLRSIVHPISDSRMISRLSSALSHVIKADPVNDPGQRTLVKGDLMLLQNFEFNANSFLSTTLLADYSVNVDRPNGKIDVSVPPFFPNESVISPKGSTHYVIKLAGAEFDFNAGLGQMEIADSGLLPCDSQPTAALNLEANVPVGSNLPLFALLGIEFYQVALNGKIQKMSSGSFNALAIVNVNKI